MVFQSLGKFFKRILLYTEGKQCELNFSSQKEFFVAKNFKYSPKFTLHTHLLLIPNHQATVTYHLPMVEERVSYKLKGGSYANNKNRSDHGGGVREFLGHHTLFNCTFCTFILPRLDIITTSGTSGRNKNLLRMAAFPFQLCGKKTTTGSLPFLLFGVDCTTMTQ